MAKNRDIITHYLKHFPKMKTEFHSACALLERDLLMAVNDYEQELRNIKSNYESFENNHGLEYKQLETDFHDTIGFIASEYNDVFDKLNSDLENHDLQTQKLILEENDRFKDIMSQIDNLKQQAYDKYLELTQSVSQKIDHEMKVHSNFISNEEANLKNIQKLYQEINTEQANRLIWTIEQSKNALEALTTELRSSSMNEVAFMNESVLKILESLRETKNRITILFKTTTDLFSKQKTRIQKLDSERQKPHSLLNQTIIRQYVKQIRDVNHKKTVFEQMIRSELKESLAILGNRIIDLDAGGNKLETEKAILQYEIVQKKADYLLHKNQAMADLLISKYQNEIKKIKIDSFKRVEEIKLSYYMPAAFFQNSINLYSNFAFYTKESFDELDSLLSGLIDFNQRLADAKTDYIALSAKTVEDYKINVMVHVNSLTTKLTDLITKIDLLSKEIITLESKNQLEVAEIRKKMESVEISGDYQKYIASLENDEYFTCYQHDINMQRMRSDRSYTESLLLIEKSVTSIHKEKAVVSASIKQLQALTSAEKKIRDMTFDKELAIFYASHAKLINEQVAKQKLEAEKLKFHFAETNHLLARGYDDLRSGHLKAKEAGSTSVVDYIHRTQLLIDYNESEFAKLAKRIEASDSDREYAYYLETNRTRLIENVKLQARQKSEKSEQALTLYNRHFFDTLLSISSLFDNHLLYLKWMLARLDLGIAPSQAALLLNNEGHLHFVCASIERAFSLVDKSLLSIRRQTDYKPLSRRKRVYFTRYLVLAGGAMAKLRKNAKSAKRQRAILEAFYIESLTLITQMAKDLRSIIQSTEISVIENDVLLIERIKRQTAKTIAIIDREFDKLIYQAVKSGKRKDKQIKHESMIVGKLTRVFKRKVTSVNEIYLLQTRDEEAKLAYVKKELGKIIQDNEKALARQIVQDKSRFIADKNTLDKRYQDFVKAYQTLKSHSETIYKQEADFIDRISSQKLKDYDDALITLDKKVISLPVDSFKLQTQIESEKMALVEKRKLMLRDQLAAMEGQKYSSRPKYLEQIEVVRDRLTADYLELYKNIQVAETDFLSHFHATDESFATDFSKFLKEQGKYNEIINKDRVPLIPFESFFAFQEAIYHRTEAAFRETIEKTELTKQMITNEENRMKAKEKRIIG